MDFEALGISREDLLAKIVENAADKLLDGAGDGGDVFTMFDQRMREAIKGKMTEIVVERIRKYGERAAA